MITLTIKFSVANIFTLYFVSYSRFHGLAVDVIAPANLIATVLKAITCVTTVSV